MDKPIWILKHRDPKNGLYFNIGTELKLADFKINVIKYESELIKLKSLINQAIIKGLIVYADYNFLSYSISYTWNWNNFNFDYFRDRNGQNYFISKFIKVK